LEIRLGDLEVVTAFRAKNSMTALLQHNKDFACPTAGDGVMTASGRKRLSAGCSTKLLLFSA
jgi:hypothetical protein